MKEVIALEDTGSKLRLVYDANVIFIHIDGYENMSPSFARGLLKFLNSDEALSHTLVASMPNKLGQRLAKHLRLHNFSLKCSRYELGTLVDHFVRTHKVEVTNA